MKKVTMSATLQFHKSQLWAKKNSAGKGALSEHWGMTVNEQKPRQEKIKRWSRLQWGECQDFEKLVMQQIYGTRKLCTPQEPGCWS
jgi:hypothetical protein